MGDIGDIPTRPTNADLARAVMQTHLCLEEHRDDTASQFKSALEWREVVNANLKTLNTGNELVLSRGVKFAVGLSVLTAIGGVPGIAEGVRMGMVVWSPILAVIHAIGGVN